MGAVDLVVQVESPGSVSARACSASAGPATRWASRAGAGSSPSTGATCRGGRGRRPHARRADRGDPLPAQPARRAGPADRGDVRARRLAGRRAGRARAPAPPTSPSSPTRCSPSVLDLLAGRYPSDEFAELRPRIVWDRVEGTVRARAGAQRLAVTSGGTIPDRGLFGVFLPDGTRVGELDEEMVYESRVGRDVPARRVDVAHRGDHPRAGVVTPAPGPARQDAVLARRRARPAARARPGGRRVRARRCRALPAATALGPPAGRPRPRRGRGRATCSQYLDEQAEATRRACPTTAPSSSSASATRSATGGCASSRRSARGCTRRGRSRSRPG